MTMPEIRYRRLLALYPRDFRREYEEEMLGVLMADPRPGPAQVFDVLRGALAAHLRGSARESRAARVVQVFGAMLLFAVALRRVSGGVRGALRDYLGSVPVDAVSWVRLAGWGVVLVAAFVGWRMLGAVGATAGLAGEILSPARFYLDTPASVLWAFWLIVAAVVVLIAGLVAERGRARPAGWGWVAAAGMVLVVQGTLISYSWRWAVAGLAVALVGAAVLRQEPGLRRRLACWAAPVIVTVPLVQWGFGGFIEYNMRHPESTQLIGPLQWAALVLVPVAAFAGASVLDRRGLPPAPARQG
ncbi:hypothetical protein [Actinoplanes sp. M2I2]|uniref:hypothetical protein n=1 Tax=Actinoplanes sp. M2I2 TaxID=1734444 RepID=UPI002022188D|nr:hypothetical protein [Actinoplanes sp. M2I2]